MFISKNQTKRTAWLGVMREEKENFEKKKINWMDELPTRHAKGPGDIMSCFQVDRKSNEKVFNAAIKKKTACKQIGFCKNSVDP